MAALFYLVIINSMSSFIENFMVATLPIVEKKNILAPTVYVTCLTLIVLHTCVNSLEVVAATLFSVQKFSKWGACCSW